ncbi:MAG: tyrosine-protein kinase family protein, partial [Nostoc sp.]
VLIGQAEFSRTTQEVMVNLDVLTVGTIPSNPAALLDSQRMSLLIQEAVQNYDFVIIDTPALSLFGDGLMVGKMADGILLVVRPGVLDSALAKSTKMMLEQARSPVLGMVVNGVTADSGYIYYSQKGYYDKNSSDAYGGKLRNGKGEVKLPNIHIS